MKKIHISIHHPGLTIVQPLSPLLSITGADIGMIYDGRDTLYDGNEGVLLMLVTYRRTRLQVWPAQCGKGDGIIKDWGWNGILEARNTFASRDGRIYVLDGSEIVPAAEYNAFLLDVDAGTHDRTVLRLIGKEYPKYWSLNTMVNSLRVTQQDGSGNIFNPAMFYRAYRFQTVPEGGGFGWRITAGPDVLDLPNGDTIYLAGRALRKVMEGRDGQ